MAVLWHLPVEDFVSHALSCFVNFAAKALRVCRVSTAPRTHLWQRHFGRAARINVIAFL